jgi:hypothetical protein
VECATGEKAMKVYILMGHDPVDAYTDRSLALYDAWLMTEGERYDESPTEYWVKCLEVIEQELIA